MSSSCRYRIALGPDARRAGGVDYDGGEFVLMEQRPRAQSRAHVLTPPRGAFVIFPTQRRPNRGRNGSHRIGMRDGVSTVTRGSAPRSGSSSTTRVSAPVMECDAGEQRRLVP